MSYFSEEELNTLSNCPRNIVAINRIQIKNALILLGKDLLEKQEEIRKDFPSFEIKKAVTIYCKQDILDRLYNDTYLDSFEGFDKRNFKNDVDKLLSKRLSSSNIRFSSY